MIEDKSNGDRTKCCYCGDKLLDSAIKEGYRYCELCIIEIKADVKGLREGNG
jgi:hypothetical protein